MLCCKHTICVHMCVCVCCQVATPEGELVVSLMCEEWLPRCADLLADTFVDTKGIEPYRCACHVKQCSTAGKKHQVLVASDLFQLEQ